MKVAQCRAAAEHQPRTPETMIGAPEELQALFERHGPAADGSQVL